MEIKERIPNVVDFAYQIVDMNEELLHLRSENNRLKRMEKEYGEFVHKAITEDQRMMDTMFHAALQVIGDLE